MNNDTINNQLDKRYEFGFTTNIEQDTLPPGLNEDVIKIISNKKNEPEWLLNWRLNAFKKWKKKTEPKRAKINYHEIDYQKIDTARQHWPFLRDRRTEFYKDILKNPEDE